MMKLSIMRDFLESDASEVIVHSLLENWGFDQGSVQFLRASSNFVFIFERNSEKFILRLTPNGNRGQLMDEVSLLSYLSENEVSVNTPMLSKNGKMIEEANSELGIFQAVVFNFLQGTQYEIDELSERQFYLWGEALGNLHNQSQQFYKMNSTWNDAKQQLAEVDKWLPKKEIFAHRELETIKTWLTTLEINHDNYGVIHFDFELDNLIWKGDHVQIIDFESSMQHWYAADIAFALRDLFPGDVILKNESFQLFLDGYRSNRDLTDSEVSELPMFLRLHNLITFTDLLRTLNIVNDMKNPQWIVTLTKKLAAKIDDYRDGFKWERL